MSPYSRSSLKLPLGLLVILFLAPIWAQFPIAVCRLTTGHQTSNVPIFEAPWASTAWTERVKGQQWWQCSLHCPVRFLFGHIRLWGTEMWPVRRWSWSPILTDKNSKSHMWPVASAWLAQV